MEIPRYDIDTDENGNLLAAAPDTIGLPAEIADATRRRNLTDIAEREHTAEQLTAARLAHREWMRSHGVGDAMQAAALRLQNMNGATVKQRALVLHAAVAVFDEARSDRDQVPTLDNPSGDPGEGAGRKGRKGKGKKGQGPAKSKRSTSFVKRIGTSVVSYRVAVSVPDATLLEVLRAGGFRRRPEEITTEIAWGWCPIDDPASSTAEIGSLPTIGSDPEFVVFGLRRDAKTGCPTHRFRYESEREATLEASAAGKTNASSQRIKELTEIRVSNWYRSATPQTTVIPVSWHRPTSTLHVHSTNAEALTQAALLASPLGAMERVPGNLDGMPGDLHRTDLRSSDGAATGDANAGADLLLWLTGKAIAGVAKLQLPHDTLPSDPKADGTLEWWLDDAVEMERRGADEKPLRVKLSGAPGEGGSLAAALADGAVLRSARVVLVFQDKRWSVNLGLGGVVTGWKLPVLTKPDGTPAGLDAAIDERLRLWRDGDALLVQLVAAFRAERVVKGLWRQRTGAIQREIIKGIDHIRERFISSTGQVSMFAEQIAEHVEHVNAEAAPRARGRKARGAEASDAAAEMP